MTGQPDFSWVFQQPQQKILSLLDDQARFVGGSVRNTLLGQLPDDFDIATVYTPVQVIERLSRASVTTIPTGLSHGTITAIMQGGLSFEITTLRRDIETDGRHANVVFTDSFEEDAARRDFTINALSVDGRGCLYDYFGGQHDLEKGLIRFIGDPVMRIQEDALRILRFFRFYAYYGRVMDAGSISACHTLRRHILSLSKERITKEVLKLLSAPDPWAVIFLLQERDFFPYILGSDGTSLLCGLNSIETTCSIKAVPLVRLACLGHTFSQLLLSRAQASFLKQVRILLPFHFEDVVGSLCQYGYEMTCGRLFYTAAHTLSTGASKALVFDSFAEMLAIIDQTIPPFPVRGSDLLAQGAEQGPHIAHALAFLRNWWIEQRFVPDRAACLDHYRSSFFLSEGK